MRSRWSFRCTARGLSLRTFLWLQVVACSSAGHAAVGGMLPQATSMDGVTSATSAGRGGSGAALAQASAGAGAAIDSGTLAAAGATGSAGSSAGAGDPAAGGTRGSAANAGASAAGSGGSPAAVGGASTAGSDSRAAGGGAGISPPSAGTGGSGAAFSLVPVGVSALNAQEFAFPASSLPPANHSPEFNWSGVPAGTKSLALVFRDLTAGAVKWVLWDISATSTRVPAGIGNQANPPEVPGSSQLGSLGNQGYAGPCCTSNQYEFVLWALDVDKLPGTAGLSTAQLRDALLMAHDLASTKPVVMRIMH